MAYFKIDIPKLKQQILDYEIKKQACIEDIGYVYSNFVYTESAWNDPNAYTFIDRTKKDKNKIDNYFIYLDNLYKEIKQFKSNLNNIFEQYGYKKNTVCLKFDDSELNNCIGYINKAVSLFNSSLQKLEIVYNDIDFEYKKIAKKLIEEIKQLRVNANDVIKNISSFSKSINDEIYYSKIRMKRIEEFNFDLKNINYSWKTVQTNLKK